mmetsp:Transcript_4026/g.5840  ORF Transcript_4026/g.5840 Transcript_4026/m.5840 type:complete len:942 (-) Transcript_4026:1398-4223(-)
MTTRMKNTMVSIMLALLLFASSQFRMVFSATSTSKHYNDDVHHQRRQLKGQRAIANGDDSSLVTSPAPSGGPKRKPKGGVHDYKSIGRGKTGKKTSTAPSVMSSSTPSAFVSNDSLPSVVVSGPTSPSPNSVEASGAPSFLSVPVNSPPITLEPSLKFSAHPSEAGSIVEKSPVPRSTSAPSMHRSFAPSISVTPQPSIVVDSPTSRPTFLPSSSPTKNNDAITYNPTLLPTYFTTVVPSEAPSRIGSNVPTVTTSSPNDSVPIGNGLSVHEVTARLIQTLSPMFTEMDQDVILTYESTVQSFLSDKLSASEYNITVDSVEVINQTLIEKRKRRLRLTRTLQGSTGFNLEVYLDVNGTSDSSDADFEGLILDVFDDFNDEFITELKSQSDAFTSTDSATSIVEPRVPVDNGTVSNSAGSDDNNDGKRSTNSNEMIAIVSAMVLFCALFSAILIRKKSIKDVDESEKNESERAAQCDNTMDNTSTGHDSHLGRIVHCKKSEDEKNRLSVVAEEDHSDEIYNSDPEMSSIGEGSSASNQNSDVMIPIESAPQFSLESQRLDDEICIEHESINKENSNVSSQGVALDADQDQLINRVPHPFDESDPSIVRNRESFVESEKLSIVAECNGGDGSHSLSSAGYDWDVNTLDFDASSPARSNLSEKDQGEALSLSSSSSISDITDSYLTLDPIDANSVFSGVDSLHNGENLAVANSADDTVVSTGVTGTESASTVPTANLDKTNLFNKSEPTLVNDNLEEFEPEQKPSEKERLSSSACTDVVSTADDSILRVATAIDSFDKILDEIDVHELTENKEHNDDDDTELGDEIGIFQDCVSPISPLALTIAASCEEGEESRRKDEFRQRIISLLEKSAPDELENVDAMIEAFTGSEDELLENLQSMHERNVAGRLRVANQKLAKIEARKTIAEQQQTKAVDNCTDVANDKV